MAAGSHFGKFRPKPRQGSYSAPQTAIAGRVNTSKGRKKRKGRGGRRKEKAGEGGEWRGDHKVSSILAL